MLKRPWLAVVIAGFALGCEARASPAPLSPVAASPEVPHVLFLKFADGAPPREGACAARTPPPFSCSLGKPRCKARLRRAVERLFSEFDVRVTDSLPAESHLTIEISSADGTWCDAQYTRAFGGIAPIDCSLEGKWGRTGYVFTCNDTHRCAVRVAQEAAHLIGLDHSNDPTDVMYPRETDGRARFRDLDVATVGPRCGRLSQNSHRLLMARLGKGGTQ